MISCIICSRTSDISKDLRQNIDSTIGLEHEIIVIDNSHNNYSIFSAYNEGVRRSNGDILCFMHDDIEYLSSDWGKIINSCFLDDSIGIVGFAGSHMLSDSPMYWVEMPFYSEYNQTNGILSDKWLFPDKNLVDIVACDGFCFFVRRSLFEKISFDDDTYKGFHLYDMDICMQALDAGFRVCACRDILINHNFSGVNNQSSFYQAQMTFYNKWKYNLPIYVGLDFVPEYVLRKINTLSIYSFDSALIRHSLKYRIGNFLLSPLVLIRNTLFRIAKYKND